MLEPSRPGRASRLAAALPDVRAFLWTSALLLLLAAPLGLLWSELAPRADVLLESAESASLLDFNTSDFIVADLQLLGLTLAAGVLSGLLAWRFGRAQLVGVAVALALGGFAAACVAEEVGERRYQAAVREVVETATPPVEVEAALRVRATTVRVGWPAGALAALAVAGLLGTATPRRRPVPVHESSWGARP